MDQMSVSSELDHKLDSLLTQVQALSTQVQLLTEYADDQRRRQQEWDDLRADLSPVMNDMYAVAVEQLTEVEPYVRLEDMLALVKRLARNTHNIEYILDQVESLTDLAHDAGPIVNEGFTTVVDAMDQFERKGYFSFARQGAYVFDNVVSSFTPDDVRQLGDNVVTILKTVKSMTQPEIMNTVQNLTGRMAQVEMAPDEPPPSVFGLLRQLRDPQVRRGMGVTLTMLKAIGEEPAAPRNGAPPAGRP
jgi:uncharacterized protein YjgD (DUF1641 family)